MMKKPIALIIMDGYGLTDRVDGNCVNAAKRPNLDYYFSNYPNTKIGASGEDVGLPDGQMGNSEVGHLNLGAGRIVYQSLTRINVAIKDGSFYNIPAFKNAIEHVNKNNSKLHIFGLLSDGGVHSHTEHIKALIDNAKSKGVKETYVHAFLDGRDVAPDSAVKFIAELESYMDEINYGKIATVSGRYYAMDRDKNWNRIILAYNNMIGLSANMKNSAKEGVEESYKEGILDEFVQPFRVTDEGIISDNDAIIFANFRPDRAIQISTAFSNFTASGLNGMETKALNNIFYVSMMKYSDSVKGEIAFGLQDLSNMFGDYVSSLGLSQLRIAETEKYAHVTFFFDGGVDKEIPNTTRVLIPSPKVATYDLKPEMSAYEVKDAAVNEIKKGIYDFVILNFANCDMVGHTTVIPATIKAVETVDYCVNEVVKAVNEMGGIAVITADHGNAEKLLDENGHPFSAHTTNLVPLIIVKKGLTLREDGNLGDVIPTMFELASVPQPVEMTGKSLIVK